MLIFGPALLFIGLLDKILFSFRFVFLTFELILFVSESLVFSKEIFIASEGFPGQSIDSFILEVLGAILLKSRCMAASCIGTLENEKEK